MFFSCTKSPSKTEEAQTPPAKKAVPEGAVTDTAIFAGGCFWCMEGPFERIDGVYDAISGYTGGHTVNPRYEEVGSGTTGHRESIEVIYDPQKVNYDQLLDIFWMSINPTDPGGQFADRGEQYTTAIFYRNDAQKKAAEASKEKIGKSGKFDKPIV
ncbi:MAG: peptide-methionine (S)-S-oxide reductase MsrA, partial [Bacteroidetes bacterium]|nr:peptide-methionine (S)-S-oxide reductase MsrA [Bacteroidota bacterium]